MYATFGSRVATVLLAIHACGASVATYAQDVEEGGIALTLADVPDIENGTAVVVEGDAGPTGDRFFVENLAITQPVAVVLMAADQPLTLNLSKYRYDQSDRFGDTGASGAVSFRFRTQGELKVHVKRDDPESRGPARYFLIAWAGTEVRPELRPPIVVRSGDASGGAFPWLALVGALGAAFAMLLVFKWRPRRSIGTGLCVLIASMILAFASTAPSGIESIAEMRAAADRMATAAEGVSDSNPVGDTSANSDRQRPRRLEDSDGPARECRRDGWCERGARRRLESR
jgi:hypothetical protein